MLQLPQPSANKDSSANPGWCIQIEILSSQAHSTARVQQCLFALYSNQQAKEEDIFKRWRSGYLALNRNYVLGKKDAGVTTVFAAISSCKTTIEIFKWNIQTGFLSIIVGRKLKVVTCILVAVVIAFAPTPLVSIPWALCSSFIFLHYSVGTITVRAAGWISWLSSEKSIIVRYHVVHDTVVSTIHGSRGVRVRIDGEPVPSVGPRLSKAADESGERSTWKCILIARSSLLSPHET